MKIAKQSYVRLFTRVDLVVFVSSAEATPHWTPRTTRTLGAYLQGEHDQADHRSDGQDPEPLAGRNETLPRGHGGVGDAIPRTGAPFFFWFFVFLSCGRRRKPVAPAATDSEAVIWVKKRQKSVADFKKCIDRIMSTVSMPAD